MRRFSTCASCGKPDSALGSGALEAEQLLEEVLLLASRPSRLGLGLDPGAFTRLRAGVVRVSGCARDRDLVRVREGIAARQRHRLLVLEGGFHEAVPDLGREIAAGD